MKTKLQRFVFVLAITLPTGYLWPSDEIARISDQVVYPPEDGINDIENIRSIAVARVSKADGMDPIRETKDLKGGPRRTNRKPGQLGNTQGQFRESTGHVQNTKNPDISGPDIRASHRGGEYIGKRKQEDPERNPPVNDSTKRRN